MRARLDDALSRPAAQQPEWPDPALAQRVRALLESVPPITVPAEIDRLRGRLAMVARGEAFLLQGGDCAETFESNTEPHIRANLRTLLQMAVVLTYGASLPVVKVARIAGQYAKPRSGSTDALGLPVYRGDIINSLVAKPDLRVPDPGRMIRAYANAGAAMNLVRALTGAGMADLHQVHEWNKDFVSTSPASERYEALAAEIDRGLRFMSACGVKDASLESTEIFASHEALLLDYELPLLRSTSAGWYLSSTHWPWVGDRTRQLDGPHVALLASVLNPVACKVGPTMTTDDLLGLCARLDPEREPGRLTLIARLGAGTAPTALPPLVRAVRAAGHPVIWLTDPMHGNTVRTPDGLKTRLVETITQEVREFQEAVRAAGGMAGGLHLETTPDNVTECVHNATHLAHVPDKYTTLCDPRLTPHQAVTVTSSWIA
jgi:3-deoxy-7-phosphoheptulonate synthase